jgi:hypothetical protein
MFLPMIGKILALGLVAVLFVLSTDAFAMGDGHRRRRGGAGDNQANAGATNHTLTDAQVAELQAAMDSSQWTDGSDGPGSLSSGRNGEVAHSPEPGSMLLLASGAAAVMAWRRRRNRTT